MEFLFLSVAAVCATALFGFKMHLAARPAITAKQYEEIVTRLDKLDGRADKLNMNSVGRRT